MRLEQTMRWYGLEDPVSLPNIIQAGACGVVTALHHVPNGAVWTVDEIEKRKAIIVKAGLTWSVVESVNIHEDIKRRSGKYLDFIEGYKQTLRNLASCGIKTVCYNFMPVVDWTRTDLNYERPNGARALRFDKVEFAAFDLFLLKRKDAEADYSPDEIEEAGNKFQSMTEVGKGKGQLTQNIVAGLPGATTEGSKSLEAFKSILATYDDIDRQSLKDNLILFLKEIIPVAEEEGIKMTIHPDDPPFPLLGLPRVVSTADDINDILGSVESASNGLCFCTGSFGARKDNDLSAMVARFASSINFIHLRAVKIEDDGSFYEDNHLEGSVDMYGVMSALLEEQQKRESPIPMRPDHGHKMLDDLTKTTNPGYSGIGRLKGLAELRGLELGILRSMDNLP